MEYHIHLAANDRFVRWLLQDIEIFTLQLCAEEAVITLVKHNNMLHLEMQRIWNVVLFGAHSMKVEKLS